MKYKVSAGLLSLVVAVALAGSVNTLAAQQSETVTSPAPTATKAKTKTHSAKSATAKTPSACKGLEEKPCRTDATCVWIAASTGKDGKPNKAYCRSKPRAGASKCKNLDQAACAAAACSWVAASKSKDGKDIAPHCRRKKKASAAKPSSKATPAAKPAMPKLTPPPAPASE